MSFMVKCKKLTAQSNDLEAEDYECLPRDDYMEVVQ